jgi:glycerol uptake operon antiterminator
MKETVPSPVVRIEANPVIAAIRHAGDLPAAIAAPVTAVFLLHADIFTLASQVNMLRDAGKDVFVHVDMLEGLGRDATAIRWLAEVIRPTGMLTTKTQHVKTGRDHGLFVIQRFFLIDHQSFDLAVRTAQSARPDLVELMPAVMPAVIRRFREACGLPVIAGGLVSAKEEMVEILRAGALGVSTGDPALWES